MLPCIPGDTASKESFAWASHALQSCVRTHTKCNSDKSADLPTRLLDLDAFDDHPDIRLIETAGLSATYACLSHCWGQSRHLVTETASLGLRKDRIPWTSLPMTFQDAIHFVRRLGLQYLWIDSLCIIQDDTKDWEYESDAMSTIYRNAFVTIAATNSSGDSRGCYTSGTELDKDYEVGTHFYVREKPAHFESSPSPSTFLSFPLLSRAWFYQERLLSPRVLHFGPRELVWECEESSGCQCQQLDLITSFKQTFMRCMEPELDNREKRSFRRKVAKVLRWINGRNRAPDTASLSHDEHDRAGPSTSEQIDRTLTERAELLRDLSLPERQNKDFPICTQIYSIVSGKQETNTDSKPIREAVSGLSRDQDLVWDADLLIKHLISNPEPCQLQEDLEYTLRVLLRSLARQGRTPPNDTIGLGKHYDSYSKLRPTYKSWTLPNGSSVTSIIMAQPCQRVF